MNDFKNAWSDAGQVLQFIKVFSVEKQNELNGNFKSVFILIVYQIIFKQFKCKKLNLRCMLLRAMRRQSLPNRLCYQATRLDSVLMLIC